MPPGVYHSTTFGPGVTFEITTDVWRNAANEPSVVTGVDRLAHWFSFISGAPAAASGPLSDPDAAKASFGGLAGIKVTDVDGTSTIGGVPAVAFDVANEGTATATLWSDPELGTPYLLSPGVSLRVYWLTVEAKPLLVVLEGPTPAFESFMDEMQPFLEKVAWG